MRVFIGLHEVSQLFPVLHSVSRFLKAHFFRDGCHLEMDTRSEPFSAVVGGGGSVYRFSFSLLCASALPVV